MNIRIELNNETISEGNDNYGAGGAYPTRGEKWAAGEIELAVAGMVVPEAEDGNEALEKAGEIKVNVETKGEWPDVMEWVGTVISSRGTEKFTVTVS